MIAVPHDWQNVDVAGIQGAVNDGMGVPRGKVAIGGGRL